MEHLSAHLFWDVDRSAVDSDRHAAWLVKRVLEYGRWRDWQILVELYGKRRLGQVVTGLRSLHPRLVSFCSAWFQLPPSSFRCCASITLFMKRMIVVSGALVGLYFLWQFAKTSC